MGTSATYFSIGFCANCSAPRIRIGTTFDSWTPTRWLPSQQNDSNRAGRPRSSIMPAIGGCLLTVRAHLAQGGPGWFRLPQQCCVRDQAVARHVLSILLCQYDVPIVEELNRWAALQAKAPGCTGVEVTRVDWRARFERSVSNSEALTLLSFDPDVFDRHGTSDGRKKKPDDLERVATAVESMPAYQSHLATTVAYNQMHQPERGSAVLMFPSVPSPPPGHAKR